jgi:hypothetical protein
MNCSNCKKTVDVSKGFRKGFRYKTEDEKSFRAKEEMFCSMDCVKEFWEKVQDDLYKERAASSAKYSNIGNACGGGVS